MSTLGLALMASAIATPAAAQSTEEDRPTTVVPRIGVTVGEEQFTVGFELPMSNAASVEHMVFAPSFDVGFGSSRMSLRANANVGYAFPSGSGDSRIFPLIGVGIYYESLDVMVVEGSPIEESNTGFGVNVGAGTQVGSLVLEGLIGIKDLPDFMVTVGYALGF